MNVVDLYTKQAHQIPTNASVTSEGAARLYRDNVWKHHGLLTGVISDRGPQFASKFMKALNEMLGIKSMLSMAYHPETDGQTERLNQEVEQYLRLFVNYDQDDWVDWLPITEFSYNNCVHSATGFSPFYLNTGQHPRAPYEPQRLSDVEAANEFAQRMSKIHEAAKQSLEFAKEMMKKYADAHRGPTPVYTVGQKVWLEGKNISSL